MLEGILGGRGGIDFYCLRFTGLGCVVAFTSWGAGVGRCWARKEDVLRGACVSD